MWRRALRKSEDANFKNAATILEADRIVHDLWAIARAGRGVTKANLRRKEDADALHAEWQRLRDEGSSAATVATHYRVRPETVYRTTKKRKPLQAEPRSLGALRSSP
jgi:hypothetical protein